MAFNAPKLTVLRALIPTIPILVCPISRTIWFMFGGLPIGFCGARRWRLRLGGMITSTGTDREISETFVSSALCHTQNQVCVLGILSFQLP